MGEGEDDQRNQMLGTGRDHEPERAEPEPEPEEGKRPGPGEVEAGGDGTGTGTGTAAATCDYCGTAAAAVYCRADSARLCLPCDRLVHGANGVCSRHARAPLCADCRAAGAVFRSDRSQWLSPSTVVLPQRRPPSLRRGLAAVVTSCLGTFPGLEYTVSCKKSQQTYLTHPFFNDKLTVPSINIQIEENAYPFL